MPELPEVETTLRGIAPFVEGQKITELRVRQPSLRWPVTDNMHNIVRGQTVKHLARRAKYIILKLPNGSVLIHLGMSGSLRVVDPSEVWRKHDHIEMQLANGRALRTTIRVDLAVGCGHITHPQLEGLGPEPLSDQFDGDLLYNFRAIAKWRSSRL